MEIEPEPPRGPWQRLLIIIGRLSRKNVVETPEPTTPLLDLESPLKEAFGEEAVHREDDEIIVDF